VTADQWLDIVEAIDGPPPEWLREVAESYSDVPQPEHGRGAADRNHPRQCPTCGRKMPRKVIHNHVHWMTETLEIACPADGPRDRASADPSEVTCTQCVIAILRERLTR
jgi:hypothetical protein